MTAPIVLVLAAVNGITALAFWRDKAAARTGRRRISERALLTLAAFGGSPAALLAGQALRHKTRKPPFGAWLRLIAFVQAVAVLVAVVMLRPSA